MNKPADFTGTSTRGKPVTLRRTPMPDSPGDGQQIEIKHGPGGIGYVAYYPDAATCWPRVEQVLGYFLEDRNTLGNALIVKRIKKKGK